MPERLCGRCKRAWTAERALTRREKKIVDGVLAALSEPSPFWWQARLEFEELGLGDP